MDWIKAVYPLSAAPMCHASMAEIQCRELIVMPLFQARPPDCPMTAPPPGQDGG
jgi:hypothetical protein